MTPIFLELLLIIVLVLINAFFSMSEMSIVSSRRAKLDSLSKSGSKGAEVAGHLADSPNRFLSTVQIGITLVGILAGAFGGATIAEQLAAYLARFPSVAEWSDSIAFGIVVLFITYLTLVVGELFPKRLALQNPERIASSVARFMSALARLGRPLVWILGKSTDLLIRILGIRTDQREKITEEEIVAMISQATTAGTLEPEEKEIIQRVFYLGERSIASIMTPRPEIEWLDIQKPAKENLEKIKASVHHRFPVGKGRLSEVQGIVHTQDLLASVLNSKPFDLLTSLRPPLFLVENTTILSALESFKRSTQQFALVIDEYGSVSGLVTLNDFMQAFVGELAAEEGSVQQIVQRADGSWLVEAGISIYEFMNFFQDEGVLPREEDEVFHTVAGLLLQRLKRIPKAGEIVHVGKLRFEIADMDGNKIDKLIVSLLTPSDQSHPIRN